MSDEKPTMTERLGIAMHSGATAQRTTLRTELADYNAACANTILAGQYEHLGGILIFLDAMHPERAKDAPTVAYGEPQARARKVSLKPIAGANGGAGRRIAFEKITTDEMDRRRAFLSDRIASEKEEAIELLFVVARKDRATRDLEDDVVKFLARLAFVEWYHRVCSDCRGARHGKNDSGVVVICQGCKGSGTRRFDDAQRAQALGCDRNELRRWTRALTMLSGAIGEAMRLKSKAMVVAINGRK